MSELIDKDLVIDAIRETLKGMPMALMTLPPDQPEITDEQAILHLQSTGWMQNHDREMYESGLRERLTDAEIQKMQDLEQAELQTAYEQGKQDAQPEIIRCKDCQYQSKGQNECETWNLCGYRPWQYTPTTDEHFCGYAERREDG